MADFKQGDVVRLKSGGPAMTVENIEGNETVCAWFGADHGEYRRRHIVTALLVPVPQTVPTPNATARR
jgi:uncharacterized protein YodC (DUF2158 family)